MTQFNRDNLGQLKEVTLPNAQVVGYALDWDGRRVARKLNGINVSRHTFESPLRVAMEIDEAGIQKHYVYGTGINSPDYMILNGENFRIVKDNLGSPRLVISANTGTIIQRMDFNEWGEVLFDSNPGFQGFGFAGGLHDQDTTLVKFGSRDYSPAVGRWLSKDPILFAGGDSNLYGYVLQDPVNLVDPEGLAPSRLLQGLIALKLSVNALVSSVAEICSLAPDACRKILETKDDGKTENKKNQPSCNPNLQTCEKERERRFCEKDQK